MLAYTSSANSAFNSAEIGVHRRDALTDWIAQSDSAFTLRRVGSPAARKAANPLHVLSVVPIDARQVNDVLSDTMTVFG